MNFFKAKKDEVLDHWFAVAASFSLPPQEFYTAIEKVLAEHQIPGLEISRVDYREGGLLSDQRVYLRLLRERLAFDTCAAPFGTNYFFSCRTVHSPPRLRVWHILAILLVTFWIFIPLWQWLGLVYAIIAIVGLMLAVAQMFRNTLSLGLANVDALLLKIPAIGPVYEVLFRAETYYRHDTRLFYLSTVPQLIRKVADDLTAAKGVKLVRQFESAPILGELYRPVVPTTPLRGEK